MTLPKPSPGDITEGSGPAVWDAPEGRVPAPPSGYGVTWQRHVNRGHKLQAQPKRPGRA